MFDKTRNIPMKAILQYLKKLCEGLIEVSIKVFEALNNGVKKLNQFSHVANTLEHENLKK